MLSAFSRTGLTRCCRMRSLSLAAGASADRETNNRASPLSTRTTPAPSAPLSLTSASSSVRTYAKKVPSSSKGKKQNNDSKRAVDMILDEMSDSDSDDEDEAARSKSGGGGRLDDTLEEVSPHNSAAARFISSAQKGVVHKRKSDSKGGKMKGKSAHAKQLTYSEVRRVVDVDEYWVTLEKELLDLRTFFARQLTVRSSTALDDLPVVLEGDTFPLREVANLSKKDPKRIIVDSSSFPQATKSIADAIRNSGMNLNPQQEGTRIYVPLPKVTREHRERLAKGAKTRLTETKDKMRKVQNRFTSLIGDLELKGEHPGIPKDDITATKDVIRAIEQHFAAEAEKTTTAKQKELMGEK